MEKQIKALYVRIPKDLWVFLKETSIKQEISLSQVVNNGLEKLFRNKMNKAVDND